MASCRLEVIRSLSFVLSFWQRSSYAVSSFESSRSLESFWIFNENKVRVYNSMCDRLGYPIESQEFFPNISEHRNSIRSRWTQRVSLSFPVTADATKFNYISFLFNFFLLLHVEFFLYRRWNFACDIIEKWGEGVSWWYIDAKTKITRATRSFVFVEIERLVRRHRELLSSSHRFLVCYL